MNKGRAYPIIKFSRFPISGPESIPIPAKSSNLLYFNSNSPGKPNSTWFKEIIIKKHLINQKKTLYRSMPAKVHPINA